ncbi:MAG TPA: glycerophosphodiester phosphodiesterase [Polyangiaceae bacterium]|jgi:glycerophosphoryl diester phosphodiesterase|nr:glycerophosphodiester phosphodiesterase [Polyangiaceae bacterium]
MLVEANPILPGRWRRGPSRPLVLGHRGARHAAPENTLAAFELARREGADGTELDVQLSSDGVAYVVHDLDLSRVTAGREPGEVRRMSSSALDRVRVEGGEPIPRLEQILHWAHANGQLLNIELKTASARADDVAEVVAKLLAEFRDAPEWALVSSFHPRLLGKFRVRDTRVPSALIFSARHAALFRLGWSEFLGYQALHPEASALLSSPIRKGLPGDACFNVWTVNDPDQARSLSALGVNALISDCPGRILSALGSDAS